MPVAATIPDSRDPSGLEALFPSATSKSVGIRLFLPWRKEIQKLQLCLLGLCPEGRACPSTHHQGLCCSYLPFVFSFSQPQGNSSLFEGGVWKDLPSLIEILSTLGVFSIYRRAHILDTKARKPPLIFLISLSHPFPGDTDKEKGSALNEGGGEGSELKGE